jgi:alkylhydroperoxidase family enzyme
MMDATWKPGPYTLGKWGQDVAAHLPAVLTGAANLVDGFRGPERLLPDTRVAIQLRLAKLLGCPVCRALFPGVARRAGLSDSQVHAALNGEIDQLPPEASAALTWVEAILSGGGSPPLAVPDPATRLSAKQRDHLAVYTRLDIVVHSTGLLFLPHSMIEQAFAG